MFGRPPPTLASAMRLLAPSDVAVARRALAAHSVAFVAQNVAAAVAALQNAAAEANEYRRQLREERCPSPPDFQVGDRVLTKAVTKATKLDNRVSFDGPFDVSKVTEDGHTLQLSWNNLVVAERVASRRCRRYIDPMETPLIKNAGPPPQWLSPPGVSIPQHWVDPDVLAFDAHHRHASNRAAAARDN